MFEIATPADPATKWKSFPFSFVLLWSIPSPLEYLTILSIFFCTRVSGTIIAKLRAFASQAIHSTKMNANFHRKHSCNRTRVTMLMAVLLPAETATASQLQLSELWAIIAAMSLNFADSTETHCSCTWQLLCWRYQKKRNWSESINYWWIWNRCHLTTFWECSMCSWSSLDYVTDIRRISCRRCHPRAIRSEIGVCVIA